MSELEQRFHAQKAQAAKLADRNLRDWTLAHKKVESLGQELQKIENALRAWLGQQVEEPGPDTDTIQSSVDRIWESIHSLQSNADTGSPPDAEIDALEAENSKLRNERVCLDDELMGCKLAIQEQESELLALRLQHEEDVQENAALRKQVEELATVRQQHAALQGRGRPLQRTIKRRLEEQIKEQESLLLQGSERELDLAWQMEALKIEIEALKEEAADRSSNVQ